jgi:DNA-binding NarL/FixJ family response regulator
MHRPTVLLADDHAMIREQLLRLLKEEDFDVVGAVADGDLLRDAAIQLRPDVIVTDLSMPGLHIFDALECLKADGLDSKVVVLTMHADADLAVRALSAGASGYLLKCEAGDALVAVIRHVLQSGIYVTPVLRQDVMERMPPPRDAPDET